MVRDYDDPNTVVAESTANRKGQFKFLLRHAGFSHLNAPLHRIRHTKL